MESIYVPPKCNVNKEHYQIALYTHLVKASSWEAKNPKWGSNTKGRKLDVAVKEELHCNYISTGRSMHWLKKGPSLLDFFHTQKRFYQLHAKWWKFWPWIRPHVNNTNAEW